MTAPAVLVADDDEMLRELIQQVLEASGFRVVPAASCDELLAALGEQPPEIAVLVLDLGLAGEGARMALERFRQVRPGAGVVLTSGLPPEPALHALAGGQRTVFLQKPFSPAALCGAVTDLLGAAEGSAPPQRSPGER